tara:strand:+ start:15 stop:356 length:342 start_codon:yes stop_codon:yes gene_type:complete
MKKIAITIGLIAITLLTKAQDTICIMVTPTHIVEFNYFTDTILERTKHFDDTHIYVAPNEVLVLDLFDQNVGSGYRKVIKTNKNGVKSINFYKSIAEFYYINGPMKVLVEKVY